MRKFYFVILATVFTILLLGNTKPNPEGIPLKDFKRESRYLDSLSLRSEKQLGEIVILPNGDFDQMEAASIISRLDLLPTSMLTKINQQGIKIKLFSGKLTDNSTAKHLSGVTPKGYVGKTKWDDVPGIGGSKTVLVKIGASEKGKGHSSVNLELHELAHSVDRYVYDEIRYNAHFLNIWKNECSKLFPGKSYFLTFPEEYFAETFAMFFLNDETRDTLQSNAPKTFAFFQTLK